MKVGNRSRQILMSVAGLAAAGAALATPMSEVITTRLDQPVSQALGRDSVYAMQSSDEASQYAQARHADNYRLTQFWDRTKDWTASTWERLGEPSSPSTVSPGEPRRYGRAGGYAGWGRVEQLAQTANGGNSETVKQGRAEWLTRSEAERSPAYASTYASEPYHATATPSQASGSSEPSTSSASAAGATALDIGDGRGEEYRFDYHHERHGQAESVQ